MRRFILHKEGRDIKVFGLRVGAEIWVHFDGEIRICDARFRQNPQMRSEGTENGEVLAPMPGRILKVNTVVGTHVERGAVLLVMEAMKMEYSLAADISGVVTHLGCKTGDQVTLNQLLVRVEKPSGAAKR